MTDRTVRVILEGEPDDLIAAFAEGVAAAKGFERGVDGTSKKVKDDFDGMGKSSTDFERIVTKNLKDGQTAFTALKARSTELRGEIAKLRTSFATTGDKSVFGDLKTAERDLKSIDGLLNDMGGHSGTVGNSFKQAEGSLAAMKFDFARIGITAAPFLAPLAAGSLLGVLAAGGVGLGILGQLKDPAVQAAAKALGSDVQGSLSQATSSFGPEIVKSLRIADAGISRFIGDLKPALDSLAPETEKITRDLVGGLEQAGPALSRSMIAAKPDLEALGRLLGSLPADVGIFFDKLTIGAPGGARAIDDLDREVKHLSDDLGTALGSAGALYGQIAKAADAAHKNSQHSIVLGAGWTAASNQIKAMTNPVGFAIDQIEKLGKVLGIGGKRADSFNGSVQALTGNLGPFKAETYGAAQAEQLLYQSMSDAFTVAMNLDQANLGAAQGLADLSSAIKANGKHWDENTQAGRNNMGQLLNSIQADKKAYDAQVAVGGATAGATKKYQSQVDKLLDLARKAGLSKSKIADLKKEYESIPPAKTLTIKVKVVGDLNQAMLIGRETGQRIALSRRQGGVYEHAAEGVLNQAKIESAVVGPGARYAYAERETGGEAFVPKFGDQARAVSILDIAAGWHGMRMIPADRSIRAQGGDGATTNYTTNLTVQPQQANFTTNDLANLMQVTEIRQRIGRPR